VPRGMFSRKSGVILWANLDQMLNDLLPGIIRSEGGNPLTGTDRDISSSSG